MPEGPRLSQYCCRHSAAKITSRGFLRPNPAYVEIIGAPLVWLTDQSVPNCEGLGLTSHLQPCDRLQYQYVADATYAEPWLSSALRAAIVHEDGFDGFEEGRRPDTWWISQRPVWAVQNRGYRAPA